MKRHWALLLICLSLMGCGYHLRGNINFPQWFKTVSISGSPKSHVIIQMLESRLSGYGIRIFPRNRRDAAYTLTIQEELQREDISTVSSTTIPRQYQLNYLVRFTLSKSTNGDVLVPSTVIRISRQLTVNNNRILGSDNEELLLQEEMRNDAVTQIMSRLGQQLLRIQP